MVKESKKLKEKNGIIKLSKYLQDKLEKFTYAGSEGNSKISDFLSFDEFSDIFINTTLIFPLSYKDTDFELINFGNKAVTTIDKFNAREDEIFNFNTPQDMLNFVRIDDRTLKDIWDEITF